MLPHLILVVGMISVLFLAWRADHHSIKTEPMPLKFTTRRQVVRRITELETDERILSVARALDANDFSDERARGEATNLVLR